MSYKMDAAKRAGTLAVVLDEFEPEPLPAHIVYAERKPVPLKLRAFLNWMTPRLKAQTGLVETFCNAAIDGAESPFRVIRTVFDPAGHVRPSQITTKPATRHDSRKGPIAAASRCSNSPAYSITSSAAASNLSGIVRPSAFAVLRLITSSYFVGCLGWHFSGLLALEDAVHIAGGAAELVDVVNSIREPNRRRRHSRDQ